MFHYTLSSQFSIIIEAPIFCRDGSQIIRRIGPDLERGTSIRTGRRCAASGDVSEAERIYIAGRIMISEDIVSSLIWIKLQRIRRSHASSRIIIFLTKHLHRISDIFGKDSDYRCASHIFTLNVFVLSNPTSVFQVFKSVSLPVLSDETIPINPLR